ncbi:MAG: hypothetical protein V3T59_00075 [Desulfobacterales bacterium]
MLDLHKKSAINPDKLQVSHQARHSQLKTLLITFAILSTMVIQE